MNRSLVLPRGIGLRASLWTAQTAGKCSYDRINSCYRAGLFALCGKKDVVSRRRIGCALGHEQQRKKREEFVAVPLHAQYQSEYAVVGCLHDAIVAGRKKRGSAGHARRDTPIGQILFIGNFGRRLARELLVKQVDILNMCIQMHCGDGRAFQR